LQAHLTAAHANTTPKLLKEFAKKDFHQPRPKNLLHHDNFKTLAITRTVLKLIGCAVLGPEVISVSFAKEIIVGPRLHFATRTIFRPVPKFYAGKFISIYQILFFRT
jgi:hypothetical protein